MIAALLGLIFVALDLGIALFYIIAGWKILTKAGQPGWGILIPIYNMYLWVKVAGRPGWWLILLFVPIVNFVISIILALDVAKAFGKSGAWGFFLLFLFGFIGIPILGYGSAVYLPAAPAAVPAAAPAV